MEDVLKKKWKTNQSPKINLIGCDTIVNSPSPSNDDPYFILEFNYQLGSTNLNDYVFSIQYIVEDI